MPGNPEFVEIEEVDLDGCLGDVCLKNFEAPVVLAGLELETTDLSGCPLTDLQDSPTGVGSAEDNVSGLFGGVLEPVEMEAEFLGCLGPEFIDREFPAMEPAFRVHSFYLQKTLSKGGDREVDLLRFERSRTVFPNQPQDVTVDQQPMRCDRDKLGLEVLARTEYE